MNTTQMTYPQHIRAILVLGLPLVGGHLAQFLIGLTDTIMVGRYGAEYLAALTLSHTVFFTFFLLGSGFAWAVMPMVANAVAAEDTTRIRRVTRMGLWLSILFVLLILPFLFFSKPLLLRLGQAPVVADYAQIYLRIAGVGMLPALLVMVLKSYLAAMEHTRAVFLVTAFAAALNVPFNYALIFGNWGFPELGIAGAAIASLLTNFVALGGSMAYAVWKTPEHHLFQRFWKPDWPMFSEVFKLGLPIGLTSLSEVGLFAASSLFMGWLGTIPLAAHGIVLQIATAAFMVQVGLSNAATVRSGNAMGRKDLPHLKRGAKAVQGMSLLLASLAMIPMLVITAPLIDLFLSANEPDRLEIIRIGSLLLICAALFQLVDATQVVVLGLLRGLQDTRIPMFLAAIAYWPLGLPAAYLFGFVADWKGTGVWLGLVAGLAVAAVLLLIRFWGYVRHLEQDVAQEVAQTPANP